MRIRIPKVVEALAAQSFGAQHLDTQSRGPQCRDAQRLSNENRSAQPLPRWNAIGATCPSSAGREASLARDAGDPLRSDGFLQNEGLALQGNERWFLVYTLPKKELQALMRLRVQGFRLYLPQYLRTVRHARQLRTYRAPLFPRYMFVILDLDRDRWLCVRGTIGVSALVGCNERPMPVPQGITEALIAQAGGNGLIQFGDTFQAGQKVRIASGPFADIVATLDRLDDTGRVRLLLDMMGSEIAITLPRAGILPAA